MNTVCCVLLFAKNITKLLLTILQIIDMNTLFILGKQGRPMFCLCLHKSVWIFVSCAVSLCGYEGILCDNGDIV